MSFVQCHSPAVRDARGRLKSGSLSRAKSRLKSGLVGRVGRVGAESGESGKVGQGLSPLPHFAHDQSLNVLRAFNFSAEIARSCFIVFRVFLPRTKPWITDAP